jgi:hypothetical protein
MRTETVIKELKRKFNYIPELGERHTFASWFQETDADGSVVGPMIDETRYSKIIRAVPDHIAENLEKARLERAGIGPMLKAGLGYEELLSSVIVDGAAIASSSTEAFLFPALLFPANYLAPGGLPGRTIHFKARGRVTTLTTAATLLFKFGAALTNVIPTTTWAISGAITMDTTIQTATMWFAEGSAIIRSVGSSGTVFAMGDTTTVTVDTTSAQFVSLTGKWSLATAYSIQGHTFIVEALN